LIGDLTNRSDESDNNSNMEENQNFPNVISLSNTLLSLKDEPTTFKWTPYEDERLQKAIEKYGNDWSQISSFVKTRSNGTFL
jgi:hypothetical protein